MRLSIFLAAAATVALIAPTAASNVVEEDPYYHSGFAQVFTEAEAEAYAHADAMLELTTAAAASANENSVIERLKRLSSNAADAIGDGWTSFVESARGINENTLSRLIGNAMTGETALQSLAHDYADHVAMTDREKPLNLRDFFYQTMFYRGYGDYATWSGLREELGNEPSKEGYIALRKDGRPKAVFDLLEELAVQIEQIMEVMERDDYKNSPPAPEAMEIIMAKSDLDKQDKKDKSTSNKYQRLSQGFLTKVWRNRNTEHTTGLMHRMQNSLFYDKKTESKDVIEFWQKRDAEMKSIVLKAAGIKPPFIGTLLLTVKRAELTRNTQYFGTMDPYVQVISSQGGEKAKTPFHRGGGTSPVWTGTIELKILQADEALTFQVWNDNNFSDDFVADCSVIAKDIEDSGDHEIDLLYEEQKVGTLIVSAKMEQTEADKKLAKK